jgi:hypothetical protein
MKHIYLFLLFSGLLSAQTITYNPRNLPAVWQNWIYEHDKGYAGKDSSVIMFDTTSAGNFRIWIKDKTATQTMMIQDGSVTGTGNIAGATYGSTGTVSDAELLYINTLSSNAQTQITAKGDSINVHDNQIKIIRDTTESHRIELDRIRQGTTTQIPVGGGANKSLVFTEATGTGAPVRAVQSVQTTTITNGAAAVTSFAGTVSSTGTVVTFSSAADAVLAGYNTTVLNQVLGTCLIATNPAEAAQIRYIISWTNNLTCVVDRALSPTWSSAVINSTQFPTFINKTNTGVLVWFTSASGQMYLANNVNIGTMESLERLNVRSSIDIANADYIYTVAGSDIRSYLGAASGDTYGAIQVGNTGGNSVGALALNQYGGSVVAGGPLNAFTDTSAVDDDWGFTTNFITAYSAGLEINLLVGVANTDGATLQINALGAKAVTKAASGVVTTALTTGDVLAGQLINLKYDGTRFQVMSRLAQ